MNTDGEIGQEDLCWDLSREPIFPLLADINRVVWSILLVTKCTLRKYGEGPDCSPAFEQVTTPLFWNNRGFLNKVLTRKIVSYDTTESFAESKTRQKRKRVRHRKMFINTKLNPRSWAIYWWRRNCATLQNAEVGLLVFTPYSVHAA